VYQKGKTDMGASVLELYESLKRSTDDIVKIVKPGSRIFIGSGAAEPQTLVKMLIERGKAIADHETMWLLERIVGLAATHPAVMRRFTRRLGLRAGVADLWVGAAGDTVPVRALLSPRHLAAFLW